MDVYHTDGSSLTFKSAGILKPIGHLDFYPNNGTDQPHCHLADSNLNPAEASVCDHIAAYQYFIQVGFKHFTLNNNNCFLSRRIETLTNWR